MITKTIPCIVPVAKFHDFPEDNWSRKGGPLFSGDSDFNGMVNLMFHGWLHAQPIQLYELTEGQQKLAVAQLEAEYAELKSLTGPTDIKGLKISDEETKTLQLSPADQEASWNAIHRDKNGKIIVPKYGLITHFRRTRALREVNCCRMRLSMELISAIPAVVYEGISEQERRDMNIHENEWKGAGSLATNWTQKTEASILLVENGATQSDLRRLFKAGNGQKLWAIVQAIKMFPELDILNRIRSGDIDAKALDKESMRKFVAEGNKDAMAAFITRPKENKSPQVADKRNWDQLKAANPNKLLVRVADAHLAGDLQKLTNETRKAGVYNVCDDWISELTIQQAEAIIKNPENLRAYLAAFPV